MCICVCACARVCLSLLTLCVRVSGVLVGHPLLTISARGSLHQLPNVSPPAVCGHMVSAPGILQGEQ